MLRVKAARGEAVKDRVALVAHLNQLRGTIADLLDTDVDNDAENDWVTDIDSLKWYHHFYKSRVRENVIVMQRSSNDGNEHAVLVLKKSQLGPGEYRCSNCHDVGHQISSCTRIFFLSEADERTALKQARNRGLTDPNDDDDANPALAAAQRQGRQQRKRVDADSKKSARLDNRGRNKHRIHIQTMTCSKCQFSVARKAAEFEANTCRQCETAKWRRNARATWYVCEYCDEFAVCSTCGPRAAKLRAHESSWYALSRTYDSISHR